MRVFVKGIGLLAPGLESWSQALPVLRGDAPYVHASLVRANPVVFTGELRRRSGAHIRMAAQAAAEAVAQAKCDAGALASVFATAEGDSEITNYICDAVAQPAPALSPTRFHNSVTNAPAGYWSMATGAMAPSTAVSGHDGTFAVGLIEACVQALDENRDVLLVAHDVQMPSPLDAARPLPEAFAVALVLSPDAAAVALSVNIVSAQGETPCEPSLEGLRRANPAARALPLLAAMARAATAQVVLPYLDGCSIAVEVLPC